MLRCYCLFFLFKYCVQIPLYSGYFFSVQVGPDHLPGAVWVHRVLPSSQGSKKWRTSFHQGTLHGTFINRQFLCRCRVNLNYSFTLTLDFQTSNCVVDSNIKIYLNLNIQIFKFKCFFFFWKRKYIKYLSLFCCDIKASLYEQSLE